MRFLKWLYPGMKIKRWILLSWAGLTLFSLGCILIANIKIPVNFELWLKHMLENTTGRTISSKLIDLGLIFIGLFMIILGIRQWFASIYSAIIPHEQKKLVEVIYEKRHLGQGLKIVAFGGGTGLSSLLRGLKEHTSNIVAVVAVSDDGGSSGRLREELGVIPPGDIRNCLVALADDESLLSEIFQYRFEDGDGISGHNFGNLFLVALTNVAQDFEKAIKLSSKILAIRGKVLPATLSPTTICAELSDGTIVEGETKISKSKSSISRIFLKPADCHPPAEVLQAVKEADAVIFGPGSLYTSVMPNLLVGGIVEAIKQSKAVKIYVCNVMTQSGETDNYTASDHVKAVLHQVGSPIFDYTLINEQVPEKLLDKYQAEGAFPVVPDIEEVEKLGVRSITDKLISETNLVRHDSKKLAESLIKLITDVQSHPEKAHKNSEKHSKLRTFMEE